MVHGAAAARYREVEVQGMSPARRVVLLYAQLLLTLRRARLHLEQGDIEARCERVLMAQEIVQELWLSLDRDAGGELAQRLGELYRWLFAEVGEMHRTPSVERLDAVIGVVGELHGAWEGAATALEGTDTSGLEVR
jgi:flagellar protein FliS